MGWASVLRATGYYAVYPLVLLGPPVLSFLRILAAPLIHVVLFLVNICLVPVRVLRNLESLYVFLGVATLVGISAGCVLHFTLRYTYRLLGLDPSSGRDDRQLRLRRAAIARAVEEDSLELDDSEFDEKASPNDGKFEWNVGSGSKFELAPRQLRSRLHPSRVPGGSYEDESDS